MFSVVGVYYTVIIYISCRIYQYGVNKLKPHNYRILNVTILQTTNSVSHRFFQNDPKIVMRNSQLYIKEGFELES